MKEIHLLTYWQYGIKTKEFDSLLRDMNITFCGYLYEKDEDVRREKNFDPIYLYNGLEFFKKGSLFKYELDEKIVKGMGGYEITALDIINRWRRSITSKETYSSLRDVYFIYLRFWYNYIKQNEINLLILNIMPHVPATYFPYAICKVLNIPVIVQSIMPFTTGEKLNYILQPDIENIDANFSQRLLENKDKVIGEKCLPEHLRRYFLQYTSKEFNKKRVIYYNERKDFLIKIRTYIERAQIYLKRNDSRLLINKIVNLCKIKIQTKSMLKAIERFEIKADLSVPFYFFPLHLQPEATTLPNGGVFVDQLLVIRMISKSLPEGVLLYVKEHPSYWIMKNRLESIRESRTNEFYESILKLKNVRLIKHDENSLELIKRCKCLITVTGTAGFEAIFMNKPVMLFSNTFYKYHKNVFNVRTIQECYKVIEKIETSAEDAFVFDKTYMCKYLEALQKYVVNLGSNEKNCIDNGVPKISKEDRQLINVKIVDFYQEYYEDEY